MTTKTHHYINYCHQRQLISSRKKVAKVRTRKKELDPIEIRKNYCKTISMMIFQSNPVKCHFLNDSHNYSRANSASENKHHVTSHQLHFKPDRLLIMTTTILLVILLLCNPNYNFPPVAQANTQLQLLNQANFTSLNSIHEIVRHTTPLISNTNSNNINSIINNDPSQQQPPLNTGTAQPPSAPKGFVKLGNNTSTSARNYNYVAPSSSSNLPNSRFSALRNQTVFDLYLSRNGHHSDSQQQQQPALISQKKSSLFEKICIGTSNRMSGQHNKTDHYQNLAERYRNCTYVIGNLEITWLEKAPDGNAIDLTFLESIREITGYLLIAYVEVDTIRMPNLQIIRGRDLFRLNNGQKDEFAMFLIENELKTLELPNLREILAGNVGSYNNRNLCHFRSINWDEILNMPTYGPKFVYNGSEPECPACDPSCSQDSCWAEGPEMCQKFSKTNCSPQCSQGRCFGSLPRECCHLFCAGGCTGPKQTDCLACKNFYDDGECIQECPSMQRYNPSKFLWEPNPNGKYAFGATCVRECPEHLLRDNGACVRTCPPNKRSQNYECVPCSGPCPKNCTGVEVVHSGNIDQMINCTVIDGSITILDTSFTGYAEVYSNNTIGTRYKPMHPSRLEVFKTLREITGYLNIQANHSDFKSLSYFRNLKVIGGRQKVDFYALSIIKTSLVSLNLRSLRKVKSGRITIEENQDLCFADTIDWSQTNITSNGESITTRNNADGARCRQLGLQCHEQCARDGCWGPGPDECLSCRNYMLDDYCVENCHSSQTGGISSSRGQQVMPLSYDAGSNTCKRCHPECAGGCNGTEARHCFKCKNVKDGPYCVNECPSHKYNNRGKCEECDKSCVDGCTGPSNRLGPGGCNSCGKAIINSTEPAPATLLQLHSQQVAHCIRADEPCPEAYYKDYVAPTAAAALDGHHQALKSSGQAGKPVCRKCHHRCKSCTGMGSHVSVCECAKYVAGEQCEDHCPRDYFADDQLKRCVKCSPECNGCFGPTDHDCISCRVYRIYAADSPIYGGPAAGTAQPMASALIDHHQTVTQSSQLLNRSSVSGGQVKQQQPALQPVKFKCTAQCPADKPHRIIESNMLDPYCSDTPALDGDSQRSVMSTGGTSLLFMLIISAAIMFCVSVYRCQIEKDKTVKLTMHLSGIDDVEPLNPSNVAPNLAPLRTIKETELRKGNILGSGFGGTVFQGFWFPEGQEHKPRPVAIKVLKEDKQSNMNKEFLDEAYIMASANHPNLVRLLGICMTPNHLMLVTQLMPLGCLLEYVIKHKNEVGSKNLLEWCKQIARGMAYLEDHRMVHRDLALRNVLLQTNGRALISDFGLAKLLELDQSEYQAGEGRLPIKWLAPECFRERKFTHKSDVWAFGVTIWELLTFGQRPFDDYNAKEVPAAIEAGARLKQPKNMSAEVYKVMYGCWFYNPEDRPNFKTLAENFVNFARDPERYLICRSKGIDYTNRQEFGSGGRNSDSDHENAFDNEFCGGGGGSDMNSLADEESQPRSATLAQTDLLLPIPQQQQQQNDLRQHHMMNGFRPPPLNSAEFSEFELRHHSESDATGHGQSHLSTPTFKKSMNMFHGSSSGSGQHQSLMEDNKFSTIASRLLSTATTTLVDNNNNNNSNNSIAPTTRSRLTMNGDSCWSVHNTVSTNSLGQKSSEQPTDLDDYLLPSPCSNEDKFSKFLASHEGQRLPPAPSFARDPPHSAGLIGISNEEYFAPRVNYVNNNGIGGSSHRETNASSGHLPNTLV